MNVKFKNLDECESFNKIKKSKVPSIKKDLNPDRVKEYSAPCGSGLEYNFAGKLVDKKLLAQFQELSEEQQLIEKYKHLLNGEKYNTGENRRILHHHCRGTKIDNVYINNQNITDFYSGERDKLYEFVTKVHNGEILSSTGVQFDTVVQIGIGGSDLGPRALYIALRNYSPVIMKAHFISNVDPDDANDKINQIDFETTLFILVSKSGTTQETLTNQKYIIKKMEQANITGLDPLKHFVTVTSETSPLAKDDSYLKSFFIDDNIGGRYSATSPVGGVILSLALGVNTFDRLLKGANNADIQALNKNILENGALLDALIGVYENNVLGLTTTGVIPYAEALTRFPAHLQQLDMESNGKCVNRFGAPLNYTTGPAIFGEPGTNSQHSFFQFIHQGTTVIPLQFIGFREPQINADLEFQGSTSEKKLNANLVAQMTALGEGKEDDNLNKNFKGERPTSLLHADKLTPEIMGAILSHFENKVMFQGFLWNINSFDQEGVQLGKLLANKVLNNDMDDILKAYADILIN